MQLTLILNDFKSCLIQLNVYLKFVVSFNESLSFIKQILNISFHPVSDPENAT